MTAIAAARSRPRSVLPGLPLALGTTLVWLGLIVLIPLAALVATTSGMTADEFLAAVASPRALASYRLTFGVALAAASINAVFGLVLAWVLVRYPFPGRRVVDALVDLPFALPTAVAGIALTTLWSTQGALGRLLEPLGIRVAFTSLGILVALVFVGLPFVVRTVQPILEDLEAELEEVAASLGAGRGQTFRRVLWPVLAPAVATGFALAFARGVGEYGSVVFIAGNVPLVSETTPLVIVTRLEQYDYRGASAIALAMLALALALLLAIQALQARATGPAPAVAR